MKLSQADDTEVDMLLIHGKGNSCLLLKKERGVEVRTEKLELSTALNAYATGGLPCSENPSSVNATTEETISYTSSRGSLTRRTSSQSCTSAFFRSVASSIGNCIPEKNIKKHTVVKVLESLSDHFFCPFHCIRYHTLS